MGWWSKVSGPFREFGAAAGLLYAADRVLRRLWPRAGIYVYEMMAQPIGPQPLLPERLARAYEVVEITRGHPDVERMPARPEIKQQRFDRGARCLGLYKRGELAGYIWLSFGSYDEDEVRCTYRLADPQGGVFDFDLYVLPEHRMGVAFVAVWNAANAWLHAQGVRHSFSRMTRYNLPSRRAHRRLGSLCVGRAVFLQLGRLECMAATLPPYAGLSLRRTGRPRLVLSPPEG